MSKALWALSDGRPHVRYWHLADIQLVPLGCDAVNDLQRQR